MHHSTVSPKEISDAIFYAREGKFILFLGACGAGMSALCRLLHARGAYVRCYDDARGGEYDTLVADGIAFFDEANDSLRDCSLIVYSLAIDEGHPLLQNAILRCSRAQLLGVAMRDYPIRIAVAGSHGKSTVTALIHQLLMQSGKNPTTLSGASLGVGQGTLHVGANEYFLYECCEYRDSFLYTSPTHAVLLNLELDHTDYFADLRAIKASFSRFARLADTLLYAAFDPNLSEVVEGLCSRVFSLSLNVQEKAEESDFSVALNACEDGRYIFDFYSKGTPKPIKIRTQIPGRVGAINTAFAIALTTILDISLEKTTKLAENLTQVERRMTKIGTLGSRAVYYDFAHHPTEIDATVQALSEMYGAPPCAVFAPHTYTRTRDLWCGFVDALARCRSVYLCPIYAAREMPIEGISSERLSIAIGPHAHSVSDLHSLAPLLEGGAIVLMGAGDLSDIKYRIEKDPDFVREKESI